jgi:hypothetical protein
MQPYMTRRRYIFVVYHSGVSASRQAALNLGDEKSGNTYAPGLRFSRDYPYSRDNASAYV